eukprot:m.894953 g.894953  ORF g.894953 m.894953 type:complete len:94 (+) comp59990_c0_seq4:3209-3490(+)
MRLRLSCLRLPLGCSSTTLCSLSPSLSALPSSSLQPSSTVRLPLPQHQPRLRPLVLEAALAWRVSRTFASVVSRFLIHEINGMSVCVLDMLDQ